MLVACDLNNKAGWTGKGWSLDTGSVSRHKVDINGIKTVSYYSLVMNGQSFNLVGTLKAGYTNEHDETPTHWDWRSADESYLRVVVEENGDTTATRGGLRHINGNLVPYKRHIWKIWTKDGTLYEFAEDAWWGFQQCIGAWAGDYVYMEAYKWNLSRVVDVHGNVINYTYGRDTVNIPYSVTENCVERVTGTVDRDVWPATISWGGNINTGAIDRYQVEFFSNPRAMDTTFDGAGNQMGGVNQGSPRETRQLDAIRVKSKQASTWELVREYRLEYDTTNPMLSDRVFFNTTPPTPDSASTKLTLKSIQRVGKDGSTALPKTTFTYGGWALSQGSNIYPVGSWNRLTHVDNGQGGSIGFSYDNIGYVLNNGQYINNRRVSAKTTNDGRGTTSTVSYTYSNPAYNTAANSAVLYYSEHYDTAHPADARAWLAHKAYSEFRGHSDVTETLPNGAKVKHYFYQGDAGCTPASTTAGQSLTIYENDPCFVQMRDREFLKGREYRTETRNASNQLINENVSAFTVNFKSYGQSPLSGLWRAFSYENSMLSKSWEGAATPKTYEKRFIYNSTYQFNSASADGYGNVSHIEEWVNGAKFRTTEYGYETRDVASDTTNANAYIVDRKRFENIRDSQNRLLSHKTFMYDGLTTQHGIASKGLLTLARNYANVPLVVTVSNTTLQGQDTSFGYDAYGNQTTITIYAQPGTKAINGSTTYSAPGNGSTARTTAITYDATFRVFSEQTTLPNGLTHNAAYDKRMGTMTSVTGPNGVATRVSAEYDVFGRMIKVIKPGDTTTNPTILAQYHDLEQPFRYTVMNREESGVAGAVHVASQFYNGMGQKIQTKSESLDGTQNVVVDYQYNTMGQLTKESRPRYVNQSGTSFNSYFAVPTSGVQWTEHTYDAVGRQLTVKTPNNETTTMSYGLGSVGTETRTVDPRGNKKVHEYDMTGRLVTVKEYQGSSTLYATTSYQYSGLDLLTKVIDANNNQTTMVYDSLGRKTAMTDPDMGGWAYTYDINGNLLTQRDAKNQTTSFSYDTLDRLSGKSFSNGFGGTTSVSYGYDQIDSPNHTNGKGQRTSMTDASGSHHWAYDTRGQVSRESQTVSGGSTYVSSYTYRADGQLKTETYPTGEFLTYGYDPARRQTSMTSNIGGTYLGNTTYDALSQPLTKALGNGTTETYTYETASARLQSLRVTQPNSAQALKREYTYHAGGNVRSIKNTKHTGAVESIAYGYDQLDRLTLACAWNFSTNSCVSGQFNQSFRYDKLGNILTKAGTNYTYGSSKPHAVTAAGANSYTYDTNGNMLTGAGRTFTWNGENQPVQIAKTGTPTETYVYDGDNVRIKRTVASSPAVTSIYVGKVEYRGTQVISTYGGVASRTTTGTPTSSNLGTIVYMHTDHLGSVSMTTSATGTVAQTQEFDPWGAVKAGGITSVSYNYTGQRLDGTGLLFYNARYYDPQLARFTSADSIVPGTSHRALTVDYHETTFNTSMRSENTQGFWFQMSDRQRQQATSPWGPSNAQELNRYSYVKNNPILYTDPSGHKVYNVNSDQVIYITNVQDAVDLLAWVLGQLDYPGLTVTVPVGKGGAVEVSGSAALAILDLGPDLYDFLIHLAGYLQAYIDSGGAGDPLWIRWQYYGQAIEWPFGELMDAWERYSFGRCKVDVTKCDPGNANTVKESAYFGDKWTMMERPDKHWEVWGGMRGQASYWWNRVYTKWPANEA